MKALLKKNNLIVINAIRLFFRRGTFCCFSNESGDSLFFILKNIKIKKTTYYKENFYNMLHNRVYKGYSLGTLSLLAVPIS